MTSNQKVKSRKCSWILGIPLWCTNIRINFELFDPSLMNSCYETLKSQTAVAWELLLFTWTITNRSGSKVNWLLGSSLYQQQVEEKHLWLHIWKQFNKGYWKLRDPVVFWIATLFFSTVVRYRLSNKSKPTENFTKSWTIIKRFSWVNWWLESLH